LPSTDGFETVEDILPHVTGSMTQATDRAKKALRRVVAEARETGLSEEEIRSVFVENKKITMAKENGTNAFIETLRESRPLRETLGDYGWLMRLLCRHLLALYDDDAYQFDRTPLSRLAFGKVFGASWKMMRKGLRHSKNFVNVRHLGVRDRSCKQTTADEATNMHNGMELCVLAQDDMFVDVCDALKGSHRAAIEDVAELCAEHGQGNKLSRLLPYLNNDVDILAAALYGENDQCVKLASSTARTHRGGVFSHDTEQSLLDYLLRDWCKLDWTDKLVTPEEYKKWLEEKCGRMVEAVKTRRGKVARMTQAKNGPLRPASFEFTSVTRLLPGSEFRPVDNWTDDRYTFLSIVMRKTGHGTRLGDLGIIPLERCGDDLKPCRIAFALDCGVTLKEALSAEGDVMQAFHNTLQYLRDDDKVFGKLIEHWIPNGSLDPLLVCLKHVDLILPPHRLNASSMAELTNACAKRDPPLPFP
tara:strand:- start:269 stop:1690 length:1422 start_codon:yes stop_codon:yes gene_type:complete